MHLFRQRNSPAKITFRRAILLIVSYMAGCKFMVSVANIRFFGRNNYNCRFRVDGRCNGFLSVYTVVEYFVRFHLCHFNFLQVLKRIRLMSYSILVVNNNVMSVPSIVAKYVAVFSFSCPWLMPALF